MQRKSEDIDKTIDIDMDVDMNVDKESGRMHKGLGHYNLIKRIGAFMLAMVLALTTIMIPQPGEVVKAATYEQLKGTAGVNSNFTFTSAINPSASPAVFKDTGELVNGSKRNTTGKPVTIEIPKGFKYYDGNIYDIYIEITVNTNASYTWKYTNSASTGYILLQPSGDERDFDFKIWIQDGDKQVEDVNLIAGSCFTAPTEGARPWGDNGLIYTNIPAASLTYNSSLNLWRPTSSTYDKANYYILGHGNRPDGSISGGYYSSGGGGTELVLGYLVYNTTFKVNGGTGTLSYYSKQVAVDKQILAPALTAEEHDIGYWTCDKNVTLTDGTVKAAGTRLTKAELEKILVNSNLVCTANLVTHDWSYETNDAGDTVTMKCPNIPCVVDPSPAISLSAQDADYSGKPYDLANISLGGTLATFNKYSKTNVSKSSIVYYTDEECTTMTNTDKEHGSSLTEGGAPADIGRYYAKISVEVAPTGKTPQTVSVVTYFNIQKKANYEHETLNNLADENDNLIKKVTGDYSTAVSEDNPNGTVDANPNAAANLHVHLTEEADAVTIYKIAELKWDSLNQTYSEIAWVDEVLKWNAQYDYTDTTFTTPKNLATLSPSLQSDYFNAMFPTDPAVLTGITGATTTNKLAPYTDIEPEKRKQDDESIVDFNDLSFGIYAIVAKKDNGIGTMYNVSTIDVMPYQNGPLDSWFTLLDFDAYLKDSTVSVDKKINGRDADTVAINDKIDFSIDFDIPDYKDRVTLPTSADVKGYTLYLEDIMSPAYQIDMSSIQVTGILADSDRTEVDFTDLTVGEHAKDYTYNVFCTSAYSGSKTLVGEDLATVSYDAAPDETLKTQYYTTQTGKLYTVDGPTPRLNTEIGQTDNVYTFNLNVGALKALKKERGYAVSKVRFTYSATVTDDIKIASEDNYNKAILFYEKNSTGTNIGKKEDDIKGYTYGLNVVKIDGDTVESGSKRYVAGAEFWLYKETDCFVEGAWNSAMGTGKYLDDPAGEGSKTASEKYVDDLLENIAPLVEAYNADKEEENKLTIASITDLTLERYKLLFPEGAQYYYYEVANKTEEEMTLDNGVSLAAGEIAVRVFQRYVFSDRTDSFLSVGGTKGAAGVTIKGLDACNYILVENAAPTGYNKLAEDIYFSITKLTEDEANNGFSGSYSAYKNNDGTMEEDGIENLDVLNYKGLVLPSTGGMGTLIFTIIGILIMATVIYAVYRRRRYI